MLKNRWLRAWPPMVLAVFVATTTSAVAQGYRDTGRSLRGGAEFRREVFPAELVMRYQTEIGLSKEQKETLVGEMQSLQSDLVPLQFEMSEAAGQLRDALNGPRVEEEKTLALAERLMSLEARIKRRHLALMIRIKNALTPEQQDQLRELRDDMRERRGERGRRPRGQGGAGRRSRGSFP